MEKETVKVLRESIKANTAWMELVRKCLDECERKDEEIIDLKRKLFVLEDILEEK